MENADIKPSGDMIPAVGNRPKKGSSPDVCDRRNVSNNRYSIRAIAVGLGVFTPTVKFEIVSHGAMHIGSTNGVFWVQFSYTVKNVGKEAGNVTVVFKLITASHTEPWSQTFYLESGQSMDYSRTKMLQGDPNDYWVYQCYIQGETPQTFQHL